MEHRVHGINIGICVISVVIHIVAICATIITLQDIDRNNDIALQNSISSMIDYVSTRDTIQDSIDSTEAYDFAKNTVAFIVDDTYNILSKKYDESDIDVSSIIQDSKLIDTHIISDDPIAIVNGVSVYQLQINDGELVYTRRLDANNQCTVVVGILNRHIITILKYPAIILSVGLIILTCIISIIQIYFGIVFNNLRSYRRDILLGNGGTL